MISASDGTNQVQERWRALKNGKGCKECAIIGTLIIVRGFRRDLKSLLVTSELLSCNSAFKKC